MRTLFLALGGVWLSLFLGCSKPAPAPQGPQRVTHNKVSRVDPRVEFEVILRGEDGAETSFFAEVARTPEERGRGLMFRQELKPNHGMLFLFQEDRVHSFYMRNTKIPLDIVFLDSTGPTAMVVGVLEHMQPYDETSRSIKVPSRAALEIRAGLARRFKIRKGGRVEIRAYGPKR